MKPFLFSVLVLTLAAGCDSTTEPSEYTDAVFTLQDAVLPAGSGVTNMTPSTITFTPDGSISVDSCNDCDGTYSWDGNLLELDGLGCTEKACGDRLDLGVWLEADRIVVSDSDEDEVTLVSERDGEIATFLFSVAER